MGKEKNSPPGLKPLSGVKDKMLPMESKRRVVAGLALNFFASPSSFLRKLSVRNLGKFIYYLRHEESSVLGARLDKHLPPSSRKLTIEFPGFDAAAAPGKEKEKEKEKIHFKETGPPLVSIILMAAEDRWDLTCRCLLSISRHTGPIPYEVLMAGGISTEHAARTNEYAEGVTIMGAAPGQEAPASWNCAAGRARGEYLLFLDNCAQVQEGWLKYLLELAGSDAGIAITGPKLAYPDGKLMAAGGIVFDDASMLAYGRSDEPMKPEYDYVKEVDYLPGACLMIRKKFWDETGGFDQSYASGCGAGADLAFEARSRGYKVMYQPASVVAHSGRIGQGNEGAECPGEDTEKFREKWKGVLEAGQCKKDDIFLARDRSRRGKTLLVIDRYVPHYDRDAGSRMVFQYLKLFREMGLNVKFMGDNFYGHEPYTAALEQMGIEVLQGQWYAGNWQKWVKANSKHLDYVFLNRPQISCRYMDFMKDNTKAKIFYLGHDLAFLRESRRYELEKKKGILKSSRQWKKMELDLMGKAHAVFTFSCVEKEVIKKFFPSKDVVVLPLFIYDEFMDDVAGFAERRDIMFTGGFAHQPNVDAVNWFVKAVWPKVLESVPEMKFHVVGSNVPKSIAALRSENVVIRENPSDVELKGLYSKVKIMVIPLRYGAGVKGKTIEAMYNAVPVVSTSMGTEGIEGIGDILEAVNGEKEFAEKVIRLYNDEAMWKLLSEGSLVFIKRNFSVSNARGKIKRLFGGIL